MYNLKIIIKSRVHSANFSQLILLLREAKCPYQRYSKDTVGNNRAMNHPGSPVSVIHRCV